MMFFPSNSRAYQGIRTSYLKLREERKGAEQIIHVEPVNHSTSQVKTLQEFCPPA